MCTVSPPTCCSTVNGAYLVAYCSAASTSIGAVVLAPTHVIQPVV